MIAGRYKLASVKDLSARQYEELTRDLKHMGRSRKSVPASSAIVPGRGEPDIAPLTNGTLSCPGHAMMIVSRIAETGALGEFEPADLDVAARVLECFRTYRKRRRITESQAFAMVSSWLRFDIATWREAASRYLTQHSTQDERYFLGICKRVKRDTA